MLLRIIAKTLLVERAYCCTNPSALTLNPSFFDVQQNGESYHIYPGGASSRTINPRGWLDFFTSASSICNPTSCEIMEWGC